MRPDVVFLTLDEVLELHRQQVELTNEPVEVRDMGRIEAALAQPQASWDGVYLYDLPAMAAAYWVCLGHGHPFIQGNKRTATVAMLVFLQRNARPLLDEAGIYEVALGIAMGEVHLEDAADWLRGRVAP